jgi:sugar lactone lactonase YvrE
MPANDGYRPPRLISPVRVAGTTPPGLTGGWAPADRGLDTAAVLPLPSGHAPEDVVIDPEGRPVSGGDDGSIWRWPVDAGPGDRPERITATGGRPLGIEVDPRDGTLIVCDAYLGLLRLGPDGRLSTLTTTAGGAPIRFCNNAAVARDGVVYFTDSSSRYPLSAWRRDILEYRGNGRLLRFDPSSGETDVVRDGLSFPNGVALDPDETAVLLCETSAHRLLRIPLDGGDTEVLADLPAHPDNMSSVGDGTYWIALPSPRLPALERLLPHPGVRRLVDLLPSAIQPKPARYGLVALVDGNGRLLRTVHGPAGGYSMITGVRQHGRTLWLGSLTEAGVARIDLGEE